MMKMTHKLLRGKAIKVFYQCYNVNKRQTNDVETADQAISMHISCARFSHQSTLLLLFSLKNFFCFTVKTILILKFIQHFRSQTKISKFKIYSTHKKKFIFLSQILYVFQIETILQQILQVKYFRSVGCFLFWHLIYFFLLILVFWVKFFFEKKYKIFFELIILHEKNEENNENT